ncbi:phosphate ABC transporter permease PstA [Symmachiella dynata]|uniref:phosphate ABC transporter permease PstA n=1 Tax=Symmachiella dynata TaxID=2527995 RepID=UPI001188F1AB|nr:phosphate ABC transporter permease PstA [Symmachiella dynata]QDT46576.1 Phosphate transport system permease protein PstA [Symmachiella dynata]
MSYVGSPNGRQRNKRRIDQLFKCACLAATLVCAATLIALLTAILWRGASWVSFDFLVDGPSRFPEQAGIRTALFGSLWLITLTGLISVPLGVGAAIYLEEYARDGIWRKIVQTNVSNLAGVPSIVYGILGLGLFVRTMELGRSVIAGALTMSLLVLPVVIIAAQESLRAVPGSIRHASLALGATRWQTVRHQVLPAALPGIMTGVILALSRALGEAAPLLAVGAMTFIPFSPTSPMDEFTVMPIQVFNWTSLPRAEFQNVAAAGIIVLLTVLLCMNALAVAVRYRQGKKNFR